MNPWRENNKLNRRKINKALIYAHRHNMTLKDVGVFKKDNGFTMIDRFATSQATSLFNTINEETS